MTPTTPRLARRTFRSSRTSQSSPRRRTTTSALAAATAALLVAGASAGPAAAHGKPYPPPPPPTPEVVADGLAGPLSFDVTARGDIYVGQAFAGLLTKIPRDAARFDIVSVAPTEVAAVSVNQRVVTWAERVGDGPVVESSVLYRRYPGGARSSVDVLAYETATNPDAVNTYGIQGLDPDCAATVPPELAPFLLPYTGGVDSHAYNSVTVGDVTYVADAGSNVIFAVTAAGEISTAAVLPPTPIPLTAEMAAGFGLDPCVAGHEYWAEPVPTDVEVGPHGMLYVTSLPGGAEDDSLGSNGRVYKVDPATGSVDLVASGLLGATNLAVAPGGTIYVTELFAGRLSKVSPYGKVTTVAELTEPAAVEYARGRLYVSTQVFGNGTIVTLRPHR